MIKKDLMAIINLNEDNISGRELIEKRPLACLPIGGRYRVIDFILSNLSNSGIGNIGIFSQRKTRSLYDHIGDGVSWDLSSIIDGLFVFSHQYEIYEKPVRGDIYTIYENIDYIEKSTQEYILITSSNMIYSINFGEMFKSHLESGKEITVLYTEIENADKTFFKNSTLNIKGNIINSIGVNLCGEKNQNISLECFIMKKDYFLDLIYSNIENGEHQYILDAISAKLIGADMNLYRFDGYVKCIQNISSYVEFSKDILDYNIYKELFKNPKNLIYTKVKNEAPTYFSYDSNVKNSIVSSGCIIEGTVKDSVISRRVIIGKGAVVENSIILQNTVIEENSYLKHVICDKNTRITHGKKMIGDFNMPIVIAKGETI